MSLRLGDTVIAPNISNAANKSLSNLDATGQGVINGKADVDLTNCTNVANIKMAHNAMPSDNYIDLTLGASGTSYTAPADGYFYISKQAGSDWYYFELEINDNNGNFLYAGWNSDYRNSPCACFVPIKKGNICKVIYNAYGVTNNFRFIYAQGAESEA